MAAAHHASDAGEQERAADHACGCGRGRAEERSTTATGHRRLRRAIGLAVTGRLAIAGGQRLSAVPHRPAAGVGYRAARRLGLLLTLTENCIAHGIEEAAGLRLFAA